MMKIMLGQELKSRGLNLYFFPDSSYTELSNYISTSGQWEFKTTNQIQYDENILTIDKFETKHSKKFMIASIHTVTDKLNTKFRFVEDGETLENYKTDPFHALNNKWRQRPNRKETNEEIRERLLNYILHYAYVLKASTEREQGAVSFENSMGLIQVFQGGIGRVPKNRIDESWIKCFYDKEDAIKAYYLFSSYLNKGIYKGGTTGDWVTDNYEILLNLFYQIKKKTKEEFETFSKPLK